MCTVEPLTVQLPLAAKEIASPEDALALSAKSGAPYVLFASVVKVIVWLAFAIASVRLTLGAAGWLASPDWEAVIVQLPAPVRCTVAPLTPQFPLALKLAGKPVLAVALIVKSGSP